jgi:hypothetical protein
VEIAHDMFSEFEYTIALIRPLLEDDQDILLLGLVLRKLDGDVTRYERVGFVSFHSLPSHRFESWMANWTQQAITLV